MGVLAWMGRWAPDSDTRRFCMRSTALSLVLACLVATPAAADVTITAASTGKAMMLDLTGTSVTRIKGNKMRVDQQTKDGKETSVILDIDGGRMIALDAGKREAEVTQVAKIQEVMTKVAGGEVKASVTPTGESKTVAGIACKVHNVSVEVPFDMSGKGEMVANIVMTGPACLSKEAPGYAEYVRLYTTAAEKGFIFGNPRQAQGPGAATQRGIASWQKTMAAAGVSLDQTINVEMKGEGPMAMMGRMFKMNMGHTVSKIETADVAADVFEVPAGYKVKQNN
jgi:hypothetical protein